ncbi:MAG TPA: tRNA (cytidine(34)-2'-O)-methyltransferase [Bacilli bacterium]|jgi:tRNA (cytidine/uridine-2'-O-)-methyltransferase|nr:tRNA (cytidine(34)-2'-O)-methyltransferase [Bacilli bacterium]HPZ23500.1 tRNA (cytidine(34)-2'-O)-methyltransferase [Bacilli bacterium]HQC83937.1 tRNA (cytidine(34)-2'-O)-methyltransferase [Bacilli bacterium]
MLNIVLFEPEIPQNTGNIMRTCVATHTALHLIKPLGFSLDEKSIKRSGVNYIKYCQYNIYENWEDFMEKNKDGEFYFFTRYGHKPHSDFDYKDKGKNIYLVFGKESTGIPRWILKPNLDSCARIPMTDKVRALNLSNCVALVTYEAMRQRNYEDLLRDEPTCEQHKGNHFIEDYEKEA